MPFKKKLFAKLTTLISVKTVILLSANTVKAQTYKKPLPNLPNTQTADKALTLRFSKLPVKFTSSNKSNHNREPSKPLEIAATTNPQSGTPALRRQPTGGEKFEPKRIPLLIPPSKQPYKASPSITIINPSAYGASWGSAGIGLGFQERVRFKNEADGVIGLGFGLGDPQKNIGAQIGISLVDVSAPYRDGSINLKLHRRLPQDFAAAVGVQGLAKWGETDSGTSVYGVVTKRFKLREDRTKPFSEVYTSIGIGDGQFRSESDIDDDNETLGLFGSLAVKVLEPVGLVVEWTGQDLTIGTPIVLSRNLPLVVVPAITDVTGQAGDGTRFIFGFGYTFKF